MASTFENLLDKLTEISLLALAVVVPLIFTTQTTELFEVPKMNLVYFLATVLLFSMVAKSIIEGKFKIPAGIATSAFVAFLAAQIASTIFSTDKYLSVFGYPTRLNGGLLSQFAYFVIFISLLTMLSKEKIRKLILAIVIAATVVSLWGIPSHFGYDPSCLVLTGNISSNCWQADFNPTLRIFSTLGQPNWLASYLVLVLPLSLAFLFSYKLPRAKLFFIATSAIIFMGLVLTTSRAGILGAAVAILILIALSGARFIKSNLKMLALTLVIFFAIWAAFGTLLTSRIAQALNAGKHDLTSATSQSKTPAPPPPSSNSGTESSQIRLIVWQGALKVFGHWPILGSGPETFVSTYFLYRPAAHNQTTEWDFFYNKAHNEFLNYLANNGILGLGTYLILIVTILYQLLRKKREESSLISKAASASIVGYLITIFFGFSTVTTQTVFYLIAATTIAANESEHIKFINLKFNKTVKIAVLSVSAIIGLYALTFILRLYFADTFEKRAQVYDTYSPARELLAYDNALTTSPVNNPYIMTDFAFALAQYAPQMESAQNAKSLESRAGDLAQKTISIAPNNFLIVQDIAKTYLLLSEKDAVYKTSAQQYAEELPKFAPTYPISYLTLAKTQVALGYKDAAKNTLEKALSLKPGYANAQNLLDQIK